MNWRIAGRRADHNVSLTKILQFVTGSEEESETEFSRHPSVSFVPLSDNKSWLPTGHMTLQTGADITDDTFDTLDEAFSMDTFWRVYCM